jgi:hypothetical protein
VLNVDLINDGGTDDNCQPFTGFCTTINLLNNDDAVDETIWLMTYLPSFLPDRQVTIHFENGKAYGMDGCKVCNLGSNKLI